MIEIAIRAPYATLAVRARGPGRVVPMNKPSRLVIVESAETPPVPAELDFSLHGNPLFPVIIR